MTTTTAALAPSASGYVDVHGLHVYYEEYDQPDEQRPEESPERSAVLLLHAGMLSIDLSFRALLPELAGRHRVVAIELQGHGRTADSDRLITPAALAGDAVGVLDHLGIERTHLVGHSLGAAVTLEMAVSYPDRVRSVVPISATVRPDGMHADLSDPSAFATSTRLPTADDFAAMRSTYEQLSPHPDRFEAFLGRLSQTAADLQGWTDDQLAGISAPTLLVVGDHDFTTVTHAALMLDLIPGAQLAVLPGTTHMQATRRVDLLGPMLAAFLD